MGCPVVRSIIALDRNNFGSEIGFNQLFKPKKGSTNFRFGFKRIKSCILAKIINRT
jgi:hypothetical protein